jgi:hypothetical protein
LQGQGGLSCACIPFDDEGMAPGGTEEIQNLAGYPASADLVCQIDRTIEAETLYKLISGWFSIVPSTWSENGMLALRFGK